MKTIKISIECGKTTCASEPGKFCKFVGTRNFGNVHVCMLFPNINNVEHQLHTVLEDKDGWLQRCPDCLAHTE